jgi:hypothetical protein
VNIHQCRIVLRPRGPLEVFDLALRLLWAHPAVFARLAALLIVPAGMLLSTLVVLDGGHWVGLAAAVGLSPVIQAPFTVLGGRLLFADGYRVRQVLRELVGRPGALLAAIGWPWVMTLIGAAFCGVGLMLTWPMTAFVAEAALLERSPALSSVGRSTRLALYSPFGAFAWIGGWLLLTAWGTVVGEATGQLLFSWMFQLGTPFGGLVDGVVTPYAVVGALLVQPVLGLFRLLLFVDVRTRVDGWDLQVGLRAARLGAEAPGRLESTG